MTDLSLTAASMCDSIEALTGKTTVGNALGYLNSGYRRFLLGLDPRTKRSHHWSFLRPLAQITIGGSANSAASHSGAYVFATGTIFDRSMVGLNITVIDYDGSNDLAMNITNYSSASCVTVDSSASWTTSNRTVSVESDGLKDLPTDFGGLIMAPRYIYPEDATTQAPDLDEVSPEAIFSAWRDEDDTGDPDAFAVIAKLFTAATGQRYELAVAPRPAESRTLYYRYWVNPAPLTDAAVYPVGGPVHSETVKYAGLAAAEQETGKVDNGPMERRFQEFVAASIDADVDLFMTHDAERVCNPGL